MEIREILLFSLVYLLPSTGTTFESRINPQ